MIRSFLRKELNALPKIKSSMDIRLVRLHKISEIVKKQIPASGVYHKAPMEGIRSTEGPLSS